MDAVQWPPVVVGGGLPQDSEVTWPIPVKNNLAPPKSRDAGCLSATVTLAAGFVIGGGVPHDSQVMRHPLVKRFVEYQQNRAMHLAEQLNKFKDLYLKAKARIWP